MAVWNCKIQERSVELDIPSGDTFKVYFWQCILGYALPSGVSNPDRICMDYSVFWETKTHKGWFFFLKLNPKRVSACHVESNIHSQILRSCPHLYRYVSLKTLGNDFVVCRLSWTWWWLWKLASLNSRKSKWSGNSSLSNRGRMFRLPVLGILHPTCLVANIVPLPCSRLTKTD